MLKRHEEYHVLFKKKKFFNDINEASRFFPDKDNSGGTLVPVLRPYLFETWQSSWKHFVVL